MMWSSSMISVVSICYIRDEWRMFIDSTNTSPKSAFLHNDNDSPSIPVGHSVHMKETYGSMKQLLRFMNCDQRNCQLCVYFKLIDLLLELQIMMYRCFLCEWANQDRIPHYIKRKWPLRQSLKPERKNVQYPPLDESK